MQFHAIMPRCCRSAVSNRPDAVSNPIPDHVRRFVLTSIASVPHLEALLLLRADPRAWQVDAVARRLYIAEKNAERLLDDLCRAGLLHGPEHGYRYQPADDEMRAMVDEVAALYAHNLVAMTNLIHSSVERSAQHFADAFTFRKN